MRLNLGIRLNFFLAAAVVFIFLFSGSLFCEEKAGSAAPADSAADIAAPADGAEALVMEDSLLKDAELLEEGGDLLGAREKYRALLTQADLDPETELKALDGLGALNIKILFSPIETEDSLIYTVRSGDNLYNIAKKYGTTIALIQKSNQLLSDMIHPGEKLKVSSAKYTIVVDKSDNTLDLLSDGMLLKTYSVGTGADNSTPVGQFTIDSKLENPTWYKAGAVVPPDSPDNILGTRWLGFSLRGYGIHGTTMPETIGKQASSGCIRMRNEDVEELYTIVPMGIEVAIKD